MNTYTSISLTGQNIINPLTLTGISKTYGNNSNYLVKKIKEKIFSLFIKPLYNSNWHIINQNMFRYDEIFFKLEKFKKLYPYEDLEIYLIILNTIVQLNGEYLKFKVDEYGSIKNIAELVQNVPNIRLAAEFELYNLILGKPENYNYDSIIIEEIKRLLMDPDIEFDYIKKSLNPD